MCTILALAGDSLVYLMGKRLLFPHYRQNKMQAKISYPNENRPRVPKLVDEDCIQAIDRKENRF